MEGYQIWKVTQMGQVDFPGGRTIRAKFSTFRPKFAPAGARSTPPRGAAGLPYARPTPVGRSGVMRRAALALRNHRVMCRSPTDAPQTRKCRFVPRRAVAPCASRGDRRSPNVATTPVGRLPQHATRSPRPSRAPARSRRLVAASIGLVRTRAPPRTQTSL